MDHQGIRKGTHVGIWSVNTPNWILTFLALEKLGAIPGADQYLLQDGRNCGISFSMQIWSISVTEMVIRRFDMSR